MTFSGGSLTARRLRSLRSLMSVNGLLGIVLVAVSLAYDPTPPHAALRWVSVVAAFLGLALVLGWAQRSLVRGRLQPPVIALVAGLLGVFTCVVSVVLSVSRTDTLAFPVELVPASAVVVMSAWALLMSRPQARRAVGADAEPRRDRVG